MASSGETSWIVAIFGGSVRIDGLNWGTNPPPSCSTTLAGGVLSWRTLAPWPAGNDLGRRRADGGQPSAKAARPYRPQFSLKWNFCDASLPNGSRSESLAALAGRGRSGSAARPFDGFALGQVVLHLAQQLADRFHVVLVEVGFGDLRRILRREDFNLDHEVLVVARPKHLAAEITRDVQHERGTLRLPVRRNHGPRFPGPPDCAETATELALRVCPLLIHPSQVSGLLSSRISEK